MLALNALEESPDLAYHLTFWLGAEILGDSGQQVASTFPGSSSYSDIVRQTGGTGMALIADRIRTSIRTIVDDGPFDERYHRKADVGGTLYHLLLEWRTVHGIFNSSDVHYLADNDSEAVQSMLRFAIAQQAAYPDDLAVLHHARVRQISLSSINDVGQAFRGEPRSFFVWSRGNIFKMGDMSFDAAVLVAAAEMATGSLDKV